METIEGVKLYLNDIINNANRLTSGNVSHNASAIRNLANAALSEIDEALIEQDSISRTEERRRCIEIAQKLQCKKCGMCDDYRQSDGYCANLMDIRETIEGGKIC